MEQKNKYVSSQPREQWSRKIEFIFACVGFAVGYGNFWRFPFKCFKNGGGAFLIPFILCLILAGIPLFFLELGIGQYSQAGPLKAWNGLCPLMSDAFLIGITDAATSIFSGFVVFAIIGYMGELQHKLVDDPSIATDGPGLVFIVYPAALATLPQPHIWSVIFFLMLITLGLDSQFGQVELICACIMERYPKVLEKRKEIVVLVVCIVLCLFGLVCVSEGGMYWFHLIDTYSAGSSLLFVGSIELVTVAWIYGAEKFKGNIESMVGFKISYVWVIIWKFITPVITIGIFLFGLINHKRLTFELKYTYPDWAEALGWSMSLASMLCIPVVALKKIVQTDGSLRERLRVLTTPCLEDRTEKDINDEAQYLASAM